MGEQVPNASLSATKNSLSNSAYYLLSWSDLTDAYINPSRTSFQNIFSADWNRLKTTEQSGRCVGQLSFQDGCKW